MAHAHRSEHRPHTHTNRTHRSQTQMADTHIAHTHISHTQIARTNEAHFAGGTRTPEPPLHQAPPSAGSEHPMAAPMAGSKQL